MKYDLKLETSLMELLEESDHGQGVLFSDHVFISNSNSTENYKTELLQHNNLDSDTKYHLDLLIQRGLAEDRDITDDFATYSITFAGHEHLASLRQNTLLRRALRLVLELLNKAVTSIFAPIVVTILTVLIMDYFDLSTSVVKSVE